MQKDSDSEDGQDVKPYSFLQWEAKKFPYEFGSWGGDKAGTLIQILFLAGNILQLLIVRSQRVSSRHLDLCRQPLQVNDFLDMAINYSVVACWGVIYPPMAAIAAIALFLD